MLVCQDRKLLFVHYLFIAESSAQQQLINSNIDRGLCLENSSTDSLLALSLPLQTLVHLAFLSSEEVGCCWEKNDDVKRFLPRGWIVWQCKKGEGICGSSLWTRNLLATREGKSGALVQHLHFFLDVIATTAADACHIFSGTCKCEVSFSFQSWLRSRNEGLGHSIAYQESREPHVDPWRAAVWPPLD